MISGSSFMEQYGLKNNLGSNMCRRRLENINTVHKCGFENETRLNIKNNINVFRSSKVFHSHTMLHYNCIQKAVYPTSFHLFFRSTINQLVLFNSSFSAYVCNIKTF